MMRFMKKLILSLLLSSVGFASYALELEKNSLEGAEFTVRNLKDPRTSALTCMERTITDMTGIYTNRPWKTGYFDFHVNLHKNKEKLKIPMEVLGLCFYQLEAGKQYTYDFQSDGEVIALAPYQPDIEEKMKAIGFEWVESIAPFKFINMAQNESVIVFKRKVKKGDTFTTPLPWALIAGLKRDPYRNHGETLYNGIVIPRKWPPQYYRGDKTYDPAGNEPMPVPYLKNKPALINISVGRQLFVDDFLIDKSTKNNFVREFHYPKKFKGNPVLKPEIPLEMGGATPFTKEYKNFTPKPTAPAVTFTSGGLFWNEDKQIYEAFYTASFIGTFAYATSKDANTWERPNLNIYGENNQIFPSNAWVDMGTIHYDPFEPNLERRYKSYVFGGWNNSHGMMWFSKDGTHFDYKDYFSAGICAECNVISYNPFRKKWIYSLRYHTFAGNLRGYIECDDIKKGADWLANEPAYWLRADKNDKPDPNTPATKGYTPKLYKNDLLAYESILISMMDIWYGPSNYECMFIGHPKYTAIKLAYSRDGFHFSRPDYNRFISWDENSWDRGYILSVNGGITIHGDEMRIWYVGCTGNGKARPRDSKFDFSDFITDASMHGYIALGYATMRRDGFVSLNTKGEKTAEILTEPLQFAGSYLFVNVDAPKGAISAQIEDMEGKVIQPFSFENCNAVKGDTTRKEITWNGAKSLGKLAYKPVRIRFKLENGKFYSFWVSVAKNGRSDGYLGGGMPGCATPIDTVGDGS